MSSLLGLPLEKALLLLQAQGLEAVCVETSSRKGVPGEARRVVRQRQLSDGRVELVYSVFLTDVGYKA